MEPYDFEAVIMTSGSRGTPHMGALMASNPGLVIHVHTGAETGEDGWRNYDRNIRAWWLENLRFARRPRVLFLEWDVLVTLDLRTLFPLGSKRRGMEGAGLRTPVRDARSFGPFKEIDRLPREMQPFAIGIVPLAVAMLSREALDAVAEPEWDELFAADIFSEMRLPTVVRVSGFPVVGSARMPMVTTGPVTVPDGAVGIFHAVKKGGAA